MTTVKSMAHKTTATLVFVCKSNQYPEVASARDALETAESSLERTKILGKLTQACLARGILPIIFNESRDTLVFNDEDDSLYVMID